MIYYFQEYFCRGKLLPLVIKGNERWDICVGRAHARECLSHTLRGAKTFICRQRTRERLSGPLGGRTKQTFDIRHCFNWQGFKHKDSTFSAFFNSLQMLQLMSQTKDTFLMCRNYEQGHKRIRRASVWQLKDPLNFLVFCSLTCFVGLTRVSLPKLFTVPGEGHFLAAVQLPNKSTNKRQCQVSIRFYNWIIIG